MRPNGGTRLIVVSLAVATAFLISALGGPAKADWQYTKWTMSVDAVKKASQGRAVPIDPSETEKRYQNTIVLLKAPYESGEFHFMAYFHFDLMGTKLIAVSLELQNVDKATYLFSQLRAKYGNPEETTKIEGILETARWHEDDAVTMAWSSDSATVKYEPRITADNQGL